MSDDRSDGWLPPPGGGPGRSYYATPPGDEGDGRPPYQQPLPPMNSDVYERELPPPREGPYFATPPSDEGDSKPEHQQPPPPMNSGVTLPSIQESQLSCPPHTTPRYSPTEAWAASSFSQSVRSANGFPAPGPPQTIYPPLPVYRSQQPPPPHSDQQPPYNYYAEQGRGGPGPPPRPYYSSAGTYSGPDGSYTTASPPAPSYAGDYSRGPDVDVPALPQPSPRQRTSIACRYCRKRKIRCSGYQNTQNGKCNNCDKLRIDCVFQPVESNAAVAFIPVSAVPGGVPPGAPLYGAYGQPLPRTPANGPPQYSSPPPPSASGPPVYYQHPIASSTSQYPPPHDERADYGRPHEEDHPVRLPPPHPYQREPLAPVGPANAPPQYPHPSSTVDYRHPIAAPGNQYTSSRKRWRQEEEHQMRLPPPRPYRQEEDPRRRSPASTQIEGTPPTGSCQYQQNYYNDRVSMSRQHNPAGDHSSSQVSMPEQNRPGEPAPQQGQHPEPSTGNPMNNPDVTTPQQGPSSDQISMPGLDGSSGPTPQQNQPPEPSSTIISNPSCRVSPTSGPLTDAHQS